MLLLADDLYPAHGGRRTEVDLERAADLNVLEGPGHCTEQTTACPGRIERLEHGLPLQRHIRSGPILIERSEDELTRSISSLKKRVGNIESVTGHSACTVQMRNEISRLEALLVYADVRTNPKYREFFRDESRR